MQTKVVCTHKVLFHPLKNNGSNFLSGFAVLAYFRGLSSFKFMIESHDLPESTLRMSLYIFIVSGDNQFLICRKAVILGANGDNLHSLTWLRFKIYYVGICRLVSSAQQVVGIDGEMWPGSSFKEGLTTESGGLCVFPAPFHICPVPSEIRVKAQ